MGTTESVVEVQPVEQCVSKNMVGAAGEYYVCAELCRRNILALVTPKNNPIFDVVATDAAGTKGVSIQVKTMSLENEQGWKLSIDITEKRGNPNLFVVLVKMHASGPHEFYVYRHDDLADRVSAVYNKYIASPKRNGQPRKPPSFRWFDFRNMNDDDRNRKGAWDLLGLPMKKLA